MSLTPPSLGILFGFNAGSLALGYEMAVGFQLTQYTAHLHHSLKAAQQCFLRFTFMY
jgi:hypothetical protein